MKKTTIALSHSGRPIKGTVQLTGSKSESNRALIIQALSQKKVAIENLSEAADTVTLEKCISTVTEALAGKHAPVHPVTLDVGPAGTAMRFLTAYLSLQKGRYVLTGSARMKERPIRLLVEALSKLGADIAYVEQPGFPPLAINGPLVQSGSQVSIPGDISSQYLSSLLLVASALPKGLSLKIEGTLTSRPYLTMTLDMLAQVGIQHSWEQDTITLLPQQPKQSVLSIEPDWSAASYWYSIVALSQQGEIKLPGLRSGSLQGDNAIAAIMTSFGVQTRFTDTGIEISKSLLPDDKAHFDFLSCPDLAQTVIACCAAQGREASFSGLETLKIKETDRILALQNEIAKFGARLFEDRPGIYRLDCSGNFRPESISIKTYDDHRMAMAFAPLSLVFPGIEIQEPEVVEKSYPAFWKHLTDQGFNLTD